MRACRPSRLPVVLTALTVTALVNATPAGAAGPAQVTLSYAVAAGPVDVVVADVTGDGSADVVTAAGGARFVSVLAGRGDGRLRPARNWPTTDAASAVATGDVDGDGVVDLVVLHYGSTQAPAVDVLLGTGGGAFTAPVTTPAPNGGSLAAGDLDRDGRLDLVIDDGFLSGERVLRGQPDGTFAVGPLVPVTGGAGNLAVGDLDRDGDLDVVAAKGNTGQLAVLLGDGAGGVSAPTYHPAGTVPFKVELTDMNRDGLLDALVLDRGRSYPPVTNVQLVALGGDGQGGFGSPTYSSLGRPADVPANDLAVGLVDRDRRPDAVTARGVTSGSITVSVGTGTFAFSAAQTFGFPSTPAPSCCPFAVALGDLDGNGYDDVAVTDYYGDRVSVIRSGRP